MLLISPKLVLNVVDVQEEEDVVEDHVEESAFVNVLEMVIIMLAIVAFAILAAALDVKAAAAVLSFSMLNQQAQEVLLE